MNNNITRRELAKHPESFGLTWEGRKFTNFLKSFEDREIIPRPITLASGPDSPGAKEGYYFPAFVEMLKDLQILRAEKKYSPRGQKEWLESKYARVYNLYDISDLFRLRFFPKAVLLRYLEESQLTTTQQEKVIMLFDSKPSYQRAKREILEMLSQIKISSEAAMQ